MNHLAARQRLSDGRWDFTSLNSRDKSPHSIGYCCEAPTKEQFDRLGIHVSESELARWEQFKSKYHTDGHATEDEARECYRQYLIDNRSRLDCKHDDEQHKCQVCGEWTQGYALVDGKPYDLCDHHRTAEMLQAVVPLVGEIWSS